MVTLLLGSPAAVSGDVTTEPPLPSDECPEAFALVASWLERCRQGHEACKKTLAGTVVDEEHGPLLPTRVLDVGCENSEDISLVETKRQDRENYCALSYCWGPPGMPHLLTTRNNLSDHLGGIKFGNMPKTFQDAVTVTRKLRIRYLWIDGLCIIQKDEADWTLESTRMAEVYQNACIVIAAAGAAHPGEGCFSGISRYSTAVEVPYYSETGEAAGSIHLSKSSFQTVKAPNLGPLGDRSGILREERYISCLMAYRGSAER